MRDFLAGIDLKVGIMTVVILGLIITIASLPDAKDRDRQERLAKCDSEVQGQIVSIVPVEGMTQGFDGTKIFVESYKVGFKYTVGPITYEQSHDFKNNGSNRELIRSLKKLQQGDAIIVKYDSQHPETSVIFLEQAATKAE